MPNTAQTINPEVVPTGTALPLRFNLPSGANGFAWGVIVGMIALGAIYWVVKKKL